VLVQDLGDSFEFARREALVLPETDRTGWAVQIKDRFVFWTLNVDVFRPMIVQVDDYAQVPNSQEGRHRRRVAYS